MKLIRFGEPGRERPGVVLEDATRLDVSGFEQDYDEAGLARLKHWLKDNAGSAPQVGQSVRLGPPISRPSKIVCIGLNFRDHARESQMEIPKEPVIFFKATTSLVGPNDDLVIPKNGQTSLVKKLVDEGRSKFKEGQDLGKITYHDSCHLKRTLHATQPPRQLHTQAGYKIEEMYEADMCCGMGGTYSLKLPEISAHSGAQAGQHQEQWRASRGNGLSRLRHANPRRPRQAELNHKG